MIMVTGGAGFIGSNFVLDWLAQSDEPVVNVDKLTYAGNLRNLAALQGDPRHVFIRADVADTAALSALFAEYAPRAVVHLAAESHVDRSIDGPGAFIANNVNGTFGLLEASRAYWSSAPQEMRGAFRFLHVSTDEVYGSLGPADRPFTEDAPYAPSSPYAASKAASDHLVRAYHRTYGLPVLMANCTNNYGPFQFPEKLMPLMIANARAGKPLPLYGDGLQIRDWLHVSDHCAALRCVLAAGRAGERYNIGSGTEKTNLDVVHALCDVLDEFDPKPSGSYRQKITRVADRPGHDRRYAIDAGRIERELGWKPTVSFAEGLRRTVQWYLDHEDWVSDVQSGDYREWMEKNYGQRLNAVS